MNLLVGLSFLWLVLVVSASGCTQNSSSDLLKKPNPTLLEVAKLQQEDETLLRDIAPDQIMKLTKGMERYAEQAVMGARGDDHKVAALHAALVSSPQAGGLGIQYRAAATLSVADVFSKREANCLSFSLLFVAMARHVGLNAHLNNVQVPPTWVMNGEKLQFMRHVNVKVNLRFSRDDIVVDLDLTNYRAYYPQSLIDDDIAIAQYYNNLAMSTHESDAATPMQLALMRKAISIAPKQSYLWNNLAALYWRWSLPKVAEALYLQAARLEPKDMTAIWNLSELYRIGGQDELAGALALAAQGYRDSNPYYQYRLAVLEYSDQNFEQAAHRIERAIEKQPEEKRFYRMAADIYQRLGLTKKWQQAQSQL